LASLLEAKWRNPNLWQNMNVLELATNGFYSPRLLPNELEDQVVCFSCKVVIHEWERDDTPGGQHGKWAPECSYLGGVKLDTGRRDVEGNIPIGSEEPRVSYDVAALSTESGNAYL
jgi:Inhibitor of Apoptosis domain